MEKTNSYKIRIFDSKDTGQVIDVIDRVLRDIKVIPESSDRIDDEDLFQIPQIYSGRGKFWVAIENGMSI